MRSHALLICVMKHVVHAGQRSGIVMFKETDGRIEVTFLEPDQVDETMRERVMAALSTAVESSRVPVSSTTDAPSTDRPKPPGTTHMPRHAAVPTEAPSRVADLTRRPTIDGNFESSAVQYLYTTAKGAFNSSPRINHVHVTPRTANVTRNGTTGSLSKPFPLTTTLPRVSGISTAKPKLSSDEATTKMAAQRGQTSGASSREATGDSIGLLIIIILSAIQLTGI